MLMTLRKQLLMAFTASISLLLGAVVFALLSLAQVNQQFYQLTHREQVLFEHLSSAYAQGLQAGQALRNILLDPANHREQAIVYAGELRSFHAVPYQGYNIWGATAGMIVSLYQALSAQAQ